MSEILSQSQYSFDLGQAIMQAPTQPSLKRRRSGEDEGSDLDALASEDDVAAQVQPTSSEPSSMPGSHSWEKLESSAMKRLREQGDGLEIKEDILDTVVDMYAEMFEFRGAVMQKYQNWNSYSHMVRSGILAVEFSLGAMICDWKSSLFRTKFVTLTLLDIMRAHEDGAVHQQQGAWLKTTDFPRVALIALEDICKAGVALLINDIAVMEQAHDNKNVTAALKGMADLPGLDAAMIAALAAADAVVTSVKCSGWVKNAAKSLRDLIPRWSTFCGSEYSNYCRWAFCPRPPPKGILAFKDCVLDFKEGVITQIPQKDVKDCYVSIPVQLAYKPSDSFQDWFRKFLTTSVAGNTEALFLEMAIESLALFGKRLPHHLVFYYGSGGNSKGARSKLRANTFGTGHSWVSPLVFDLALRDEFRKQGTDFYGAMVCTLREADGFELDEKIFRSWTAGEGVACRLPHAVHTPMLSWPATGKFWEINTQNTPLIRSLRENSFTRRLIGIEKRATFTSKEEDVDPANMVFLADPELEGKLDSPDAVFCYLRNYLFPFIRDCNEAKARALIMKPAPQIQADTKKLLHIMADNQKRRINKDGARDFEEESARELAGDGPCDGAVMLQKVHETFQNRRVIMEYQILKHSSILGLSRNTGKVNKKSRVDVFLEALHLPGNFFFDKLTDTSYARAPFRSWALFQELDEEKFGSPMSWKSYQGRGKHANDSGQPAHSFLDTPGQEEEADHDHQVLECAHLDRLREYQALGIDRRPQELDKLIRAAAGGADIGDGYRAFSVAYHRVGGMPGRRYAIGPSLQKITREARAVAVRGLCKDLDFPNSHATSLHRILQRLGLEKEFPMIRRFVVYCEDWRALWGKGGLMRILYGGVPDDKCWNPVTWTLQLKLTQRPTRF